MKSPQQKQIERVEYLIKRQYYCELFMKQVGIVPFPKQREVLKAFYNGADFIQLRWGRRGAKSVIGTVCGASETPFKSGGMLPKRLLLHTGPDKDTTDRVGGYFQNWFSVMRIMGTVRASERERFIEFPWGMRIEGKSTEAKTGKEPSHLLGDGNAGIISDEHAMIQPHVLGQYFLPSLLDTQGWIMLISTPRGKRNHFYETEKLWRAEMEGGNPRYFVSHSTSFDNPHNDPEWLKMQEKMYVNAGQEDLWCQEFLAEYTSVSGAIYKKFTETKGDKQWHVGDYRYNPDLPVVVGIDWGTDHPFVALFGQVVEGDRMRIIHEISERGGDAPDWADWCTDYLQGIGLQPHDVEMCYCDPSGLSAKITFERRGYNLFQSYPDDRKSLNSVNDGIIEVNNLISEQRFPKLQISDTCQNTIFGVQSYKWGANNKPKKVDDDEVDALRYLIMGRLGLTRSSELVFY